MNRLIDYITCNYQETDYYQKKKAEYTVNLLVLIIMAMMVILTTETALVGNSFYKMTSMLVFIMIFFWMLWLIKRGLLEHAINILIVAGFLRELMIYFYKTPYQFYATAFLIVLTIAVVHIKTYQLYVSYSITALLLTYKAYQHYHLYQIDSSMLRSYTQTIYTVIIYIVFISMIHLLVDIMNREIQESEQLRKLAITDLLTGLYNRRHFDEMFKDVIENYEEIAILLIDIDYFKNINDCRGHNHGDRVLIAFADHLKSHIVDGGLFRWGGEEFLIVLPNYRIEEGQLVAETLRKTIMYAEFSGEKLTVSIGAAQYQKGQSVEAFINKADKALYQSKENGRNQVSIS